MHSEAAAKADRTFRLLTYYRRLLYPFHISLVRLDQELLYSIPLILPLKDRKMVKFAFLIYSTLTINTFVLGTIEESR